MSILEEIVEKRKSDIDRLGYTFGCAVPEKRVRAQPVPFLPQKGVILEVKRASPSKGDIAPNLDAVATAKEYALSGASAISVLTESHYFKGSLADLQAVANAIDLYAKENGGIQPAVLRKDFLMSVEDVRVSYRAGADAVLLIARMLSESDFIAMVKECLSLGLTPFIELRLLEDLEKLKKVSSLVEKPRLVCGVNSRDLATFRIDLLSPLAVLPQIQDILGQDARVVFESGVRTGRSAAFVGSLGFTGLLLGEAAARNPLDASVFVKEFTQSQKNTNSQKWLLYASLLSLKKAALEKGEGLPFVKICGLTSVNDALYASMGGADFLGFIFCKKSPRNTNETVVHEVRKILSEQFNTKCLDEHTFSAGNRQLAPFLVGVAVDLESEEGKKALSLVQDGSLDFIQLHGKRAIHQFLSSEAFRLIPHYCVINVREASDTDFLKELCAAGEPRILIDAGDDDCLGGTGRTVRDEMIDLCKKNVPLWLAGGINAHNVGRILKEHSPELIDVCSGVEKEPGKKDTDALLSFMQEVYEHTVTVSK